MKEDGDMEKIMMARGARTVVETCLRVQPDENVVIVAELSKLSIARSIANAVFAANANPMVITMLPRQRDGQVKLYVGVVLADLLSDGRTEDEIVVLVESEVGA